MFGKRSTDSPAPRRPQPVQEAAVAAVVAKPAEIKVTPIESRAPARAPEPVAQERRHSEEYYDVKTTVFNALIDTIDLTQLAKLEAAAAREEIRDIVSEIIQIKSVVMSIAEQEELLEDICNDVLGYGPLEPLLARDDIADIMVNGANTTYIEVAGKVQRTPVRFADNAQLMNICQRIVSQVGRRVDEFEPDLRRAPAGRQPRQRHRPAARHRRADAHHPQVQEGPAQARAAGQVQIDHARNQDHPGDHRPRPLQRADLRRYGLGQDDAAQLHDRLDRPRRAHHHLRGLRRAAAAAATRGAAGDAPAQPRGRGRDHDARPGQELSAHAARAHHRRRGARTGGLRPVAGHEHGS